MLGTLLLLSALTATKPVVAVLYFDNATKKPELDVLRKGMADMLVTDLVAWDGVTVVERSRLEEVLGELKLQQSRAFDAQTAVKVGKLMGAQYQLTGTMVLSGKNLVVDAKLLKIQDGTVTLATRSEADPDKVFDLEQDLAGKIIGAIDSKLEANAAARRKAKVPDLETLLSYSKAIDLSDQGKLAEAQAAMQAVVSKAPSFLLARERREELLKRFQAYELKKKDLVTGEALELGKRIDAVLADAAKLDTMDEKTAKRFLAMRMLKGRFILRSAKQYFSSKSEHFRVAKRGQEGAALVAMRTWADNQRVFIGELERTQKRLPGVSQGELAPDEQKLVTDAKFGELSFGDPRYELFDFVVSGDANDGERFRLAPALGFADPKERKAVLDDTDQRIEAAFVAAKADAAKTYALSNLISQRNEAWLQRYEVDGPVSLMQRFLDVFPTAPQAQGFEGKIKQYLSGRGLQGLDYVERWNKGLKGCDGMDLNVGSQAVRGRIEQAGIAGVWAMAAEMEKACARSAKLDSYFATIYSRWAGDLAEADDCEGWQKMFGKYLTVGGSVRDMRAWSRNTGCPLGDLTKNLQWFYSKRDRNWEFELTDELGSSFDGKTLKLSGKAWLGTPNGKARQGLDLRAEKQPDGSFTCVSATDLRYDGVKTDGTCTVVVTTLATGAGQYDEGTYSAEFSEPWDGYKKKVELTDGVFRLKRK
ncbi:MAG: hypothetical protein JNK82_35240 [Myxococcaceae bacterium]|nr:hypothetical protein [Myxococcaceae bacterium]